MMSFLALTGLVAYELGGLMGPGTYDESETHPDHFAPETSEDDLLDLAGDDLQPDAFDLARGGTIEGFTPGTDIIELEYVRALGAPAVSVTDLPDGSGASIALNGVVVADVPGAAGLDPSSIVLVPV